MNRISSTAKDIVGKELQDFHLWMARSLVTVEYDGNEGSIEEKDLDYEGMNIVHLAIRFYPKFVVPLLRFLKKNNQDLYDMVNQATAKTQQTPLHLVVDEMVCEEQTDTKMQTPIHLAVKKRESNIYNVKNAMILLEYGADPTKRNQKEKLPIHMAESPSILNLLLSNPER